MALVLAQVVDWNSSVSSGSSAARYGDLYPGDLPGRLRELAEMAGLAANLRDAGIPEGVLPRLADEAATQWFGKFNPRPFSAAAALEIYQAAY